jgi:excisionase family DNA binding protein
MSLRALVLLAVGEQEMAEIEPLIDAQQAARILKLHPVTVREMAARHELPGLKIGKVWRFRASSLDAWVNSRLELLGHPRSPQSEER